MVIKLDSLSYSDSIEMYSFYKLIKLFYNKNEMIPFLKIIYVIGVAPLDNKRNFLKSLLIQFHFSLKLKINRFLEIISKSANKLNMKHLKYLNFKKRSLNVLHER